MEIEEKIKKVEESVKNRATTTMLSEMRKDLEMKMDALREEIENIRKEESEKLGELESKISDLRTEVSSLNIKRENIDKDLDELRKYLLRYEKLNRRIRNMEEIMGVEEEIDVNKIPPSILRLVYQYTLNDAIAMLRKYVGASEAERIIVEVLQDVRTKTSGTELFKFKDGKIEAKDVEKAIKKRLISPKQIHLTYVEIINKIKEYLPGYIPKNFASLLRTKGQEYAIETSTENRIRIEMLERNFERIRNDMAYQENILREDIAETKRMLEMDIQDLRSGFDEKFRSVESAIDAIGEEIGKIYDLFERITPYLDIIREKTYAEMEEKIPAEGIKKDELKFPEKIVDDFLRDGVNSGKIIVVEDTVYSVGKVKGRILEVIGEKFVSYSTIRKETGYPKELLITVLEWMKNEGLVEEKKYGKGKKYKRR